MIFDDFIKKLPELKRARSEEDGRRILEFFERNSSAQNRFTLHYDRSPHFFSLLKLSSPDYFVLFYENTACEIEGVISYTLLKGKDADSLYVGDFKIKTKSEEMKSKWREFANDFIENLHTMDEFKNVRYIHMVMMDDNTRAYQRLVASNLVSFKYEKAFSYKMVNILGKRFWSQKKATAFKHSIYDASENSLEKLMTEFSLTRQLADHPELISYRAREMAPLTKIIEVKDETDRILLKASLEDVSPMKRIIVKRLPLHLKLLTKALSLFGGKRYQEGKPLDILYLSLVTFHPSVTDQTELLTYAVKNIHEAFAGKFHMISLSVFDRDQELIDGLRKNFVTQIEPLGFYQITPDWGEKLSPQTLPYFDLSYI